jgi:hypothetical protein
MKIWSISTKNTQVVKDKHDGQQKRRFFFQFTTGVFTMMPKPSGKIQQSLSVMLALQP